MIAKKKSQIVGRWRITSMTEWDQDFVDEEVPGYFEFRKGGTDDFQFGYVQGQIDWRDAERDGRPAVEFTFEGMDEMAPNSGRGWLIIEGDSFDGMIFFHHGDESRFTAKKAAK